MQAKINKKKILIDYVIQFGTHACGAETCNSENIIDFIGWLSDQNEPPEYKDIVITAISIYATGCYVEKSQATVSGLLGCANYNG